MPRCRPCLVMRRSPSKKCRRSLQEDTYRRCLSEISVRFLFSLLRMQELGCLIRRR